VVQLCAGRAEFRGCSFLGTEKGIEKATFSFSAAAKKQNVSSFAAAIRWVHPARTNEAEISLPSGRLRLLDCLLYHVGSGVDCRTAGALAIELSNTLHLDSGPLVSLDHCPQSDEPVSIVLSQVTLRHGGPLLEYFVPHAEEQPGEITVLATACAFVPEPGDPLVRLLWEEVGTGASPDADLSALGRGGSAPVPPLLRRLLAGVRWTGQGSLVVPHVPIVAWRGRDGRQQTADESSLSIAGLVRSEVGFAGAASGDPVASRLIRWQAPLQSSNPPGIDPAPLPNARVR
jgi:hypothetical protein